MSKAAKRYKSYYAAGWYNKEMLKNLVSKGKLTADDYNEIIGEEYDEAESN